MTQSLFDPSRFEPDVNPQAPAGYVAHLDLSRLKGQMLRVAEIMSDFQWHTLKELAIRVGGSEAGVSARIRDLRKKPLGSHHVERQRFKGGLWRYRLVPRGEL